MLMTFHNYMYSQRDVGGAKGKRQREINIKTSKGGNTVFKGRAMTTNQTARQGKEKHKVAFCVIFVV